ncbi:MAG: RagB/SusD family nutrient uptake outer membrane protein [Mediterranea sp.]|jgi:hypothetical protein|nr:RagB/SusD family nutrient uptake outer membrane protein [Mediterranea sp.]
MKISFIRPLLCGAAALTLSLTACTDYLDKAPESVISGDDAYKNFNNFQGFVEIMYYRIPDIMKSYWVNSFNWGEDEVITIGAGEYLYGFSVDRGNYRDYINKNDLFLDRADQGDQNGSGIRANRSIWRDGWLNIRTANMGLEAIANGKMTDASQAERDIITGQLHFFRAWNYFQITKYWGGMPYIETVLPSDEAFTLPRETYRENVEKMAADFRKAADLLPINWDNTEIGRRTPGNNALRVNKIWALGYLGKALLYGGSPLMANGVNAQPTDYDAEMCKRAADAFGELLTLVESGQTQYSMVDFENYSSMFYNTQQNFMLPGSTEAIMRSISFEPHSGSYYRQMNSYQIGPMAEGDQIVFHPAANYVNYFGMANGLPLEDSESGFDRSHPWKDRDPRFYNNFIYDGVKLVFTSNAVADPYRYANLHTDGNFRDDPRTKSRTGYLNYKFIPITANLWDNGINNTQAHVNLCWMRLADVYLMYAEAAAQGYGSAQGKSSNFTKNAVEAVNVVRTRAGVAEVASKFTGSLQAFMDELRRERAVELAFEGQRFHDLRRWLLLTRAPYNIKTSQEFDRVGEFDPDADPKEAEVANFREVELITRNLTNKHYWLPLKTEDVSMYPEFYQNPGW